MVRIFLLSLLLFSTPSMAEMTELKSGAADQRALALTVYNTDLALIRDTRGVRPPQGVSRLAFADVSARIRPETARLYGDLTVLEQNFDYDLLSPQKLLEKYVGREIGLVRTHPETGEDKLERGTLLSVAEEGVVFRFEDRIETGGHGAPWRFVFDEVPDNLRERPTLTMLVDSPDDQERSVELAYLTGGLSWKADYVATLRDGGSMDLTGWVTLDNTSGASYRDARLQLLAGDVGRVAEPRRELKRVEMAMAADAAPMRQESLFEYHLYTLERPTTIADRQTKQVLLMQAGEVPVSREYWIDASGYYHMARADKRELNAQVILRFKNEKPALGQPLPAGIIRFYQQDGAGATQFIGENRIDHTPEGRDLELKVGNAFDVTATQRQTEFRKVYGNERESAWEVEVFNAKPEPVEVQVRAGFPGEWKVLEESLPHERSSAGAARWKVAVPAKGKTVLNYKVWMR
jgi:hypothetical protein